MPKTFTPSIMMACKYMYTTPPYLDEKSIAAKLGKDGPGWKTIQRWKLERNSDHKTWDDLRDENSKINYELLAPEQLVIQLFADAKNILQNLEMPMTTKYDTLSKLLKVQDKITEPRSRMNHYFQVMTDFAQFMADNYKHLLTEELINAIKNFRTDRLKAVME